MNLNTELKEKDTRLLNFNSIYLRFNKFERNSDFWKSYLSRIFLSLIWS